MNSFSRDGQYTFKVYKESIEDIDLKISKYKVIQVGVEGNEYCDSPAIDFWYDTTKKVVKTLLIQLLLVLIHSLKEQFRIMIKIK